MGSYLTVTGNPGLTSYISGILTEDGTLTASMSHVIECATAARSAVADLLEPFTISHAYKAVTGVEPTEEKEESLRTGLKCIGLAAVVGLVVLPRLALLNGLHAGTAETLTAAYSEDNIMLFSSYGTTVLEVKIYITRFLIAGGTFSKKKVVSDFKEILELWPIDDLEIVCDQIEGAIRVVCLANTGHIGFLLDCLNEAFERLIG